MATSNHDDSSSFVSDAEYDTATLARVYDDFPEIMNVDPAAVADRMAKRVMSATNLDELFDSLSGSTSDALVGRSFHILGVAWQPFESERGVIPNAIVDAADIKTGESREFATTGRMLVAFLRKAQLLNLFPFDVRIVEKTTRSGQKALNFERA